jgi:hypothetical protein
MTAVYIFGGVMVAMLCVLRIASHQQQGRRGWKPEDMED